MNIKRTLITAMIAVAVTAMSSMAADVVVMDSNVPTIVVGTMVDYKTNITIGEGGTVTLVMENGETRIVMGPYTGEIGVAETAGSTLDDLTASRGGETKVLGAVRAPKWEIED